MEVATTATATNGNHSKNHHLPQHHKEKQRMPHHSQNSLSVDLKNDEASGAGGSRSPFKREVREWQRIDPDTGALLTGRLEADRWINGPMNSYGKISDSQNISQPNGTQHTQRKQLEVLHARTANGAMQVIRAQTVQKTSSRWSSSTSSTSSSAVVSPRITMGALTNGHSINGNTSSFHNSNSFFQPPHHHNHKSNHFQSPSFGRLDLSMADSPPPLTSKLEISEVSNCNNNNNNVSSSRSFSNSSKSGSDLEDFDDDSNCDELKQHHLNHNQHADADVDVDGTKDLFNRHSFLNKSHNNISNRNLSLLMETLDTAPSLKLSNLMKSNSSLSSNNSSSNNSTTTLNNNTHQSNSAAGKISLRAIVGGVAEENTKQKSALTPLTSTLPNSASSSTSTLSSTTSSQQQQQEQRSSQLFEQATLYGNSSSNLIPSLTKSRVGVSADETGACVIANAAIVDNNDGDVRQRQRLQRNGNTTPTQLKSRQQQRDLESFRHNNEHGSKAATSLTANTLNTVDDHNSEHNDDDDVMRINTRHQHHEQTSTSVSIQRSHSISTDDLSAERDRKSDSNDDNDDLEPGDWKRVSKLRRSFQSSNSSKNDISIQSRKPIDLPTNASVSVAKIRAELENGRRLNTAMRNNHVDLAALDSILNASKVELTKREQAKRDSFLTAESLKEIRAGLKKLSDESLYRDDYITTTHTSAPDEHIEIQDVKKPPERIRLRPMTPEKSPEINSPKSAFKVFTRPTPANNYSITSTKHTTHSLESRQKHRDSAASIDWHLRRKSYGFEKMSPPDDKAMSRMDASTDSGLGRSGEQLGSWSPTETSAPKTTRGIVIHFGAASNVASNPGTIVKPTIQRRYRPMKSPESSETDAELKRHSIAVDDSQYVRKTSQIHLNGISDPSSENSTKSLQPTRFIESTETVIASTQFQRSNTQQKRVEFCKTEVHFAAESGRVNIVETDGKPPPTNNFRRRRRTTSGPLQTLIKSTSSISAENATTRPITLFGDTDGNKVIATSTVAYRASLIEPSKDADTPALTNVTITTPKPISLDAFTHLESSRSIYASTSGVDTTDNETDEIAAIRGILKNKPIKPRPYHLGENINSADTLWGVQLKPIGGVTHKQDHNSTLSKTPSSVAERIRIAEQCEDNSNVSQTNNFSTKINLSLGDCSVEPLEGTEFGTIIERRRPSLQEIMLQDLREHQRILDEGLKSTSLIIKTMRSANEFDEAMRRLSIASMESVMMQPIVVPTPMLRSHSYQETSRRTSITSVKTTSSSSLTTLRRLSTDTTDLGNTPIATPRLKLLGNTEIPVAQQLTQLRRMYDLAAAAGPNGISQDEDSADEEVKRYFNKQNQLQHQESSDSGGGTQCSSSMEDESFTEYSDSWSRLKAKRTIWRIGSGESNKLARTLERTELPKSNVLSIELHSPQTSLERPDAIKPIETAPPVAKPRNTISVQNITQPRSHTANTVKQTTDLISNRESNQDFLKIVKETRGARKLREHELSYFGVPIPTKNADNDSNTKYTAASQLAASKRSLPKRNPNEKLQTELSSDLTKQQISTKWQLLNDKPDLLRHSPISVEPQVIICTAEMKPTERTSLKQSSPRRNLENDEHIYENIAADIKPVFKVKSPVRLISPNDDEHLYNRKADLSRDAMILSEMTHNADQTMKAISDEATIKDQRRRSSLQRRNSRPLETINERISAEKINDKCIAVQVTRTKLATDTKRQGTPIRTTVSSRARSLSLSSNESCSRARSRSLSSEREYENIKMRPKRTSQSASRSRSSKQTIPMPAASRSSSRESANGRFCSSGDERDNNMLRVIRNSRSKHTTSSNARKLNSKDIDRHHLGKSQSRRDDDHSKKHSSSTTHSSRRERVECNDEVKTNSHSHHHSKPHERTYQQRTRESSSSLKHRDDQHRAAASSRPSSSDKRDRDRLRASDHRPHSESSKHRLSHHRLECDKEKEKSSRSKGHSSRSSQQKSDRNTSNVSSKTHEHKKSTPHSNRETKHFEPIITSTHSKNTPLMNGHHHHQISNNHYNGHHEHEHIHSLTTATIAAKQREHRSGKDRK